MFKYKKRRRYKYLLVADYPHPTGLRVAKRIETPFISLAEDGHLTIRKDYAWDGPSGMTIDTKNFMRGSLVHDALYQLMREQCLPIDYRGSADRLLRETCKKDGMSPIRAWWVYHAVRLFGRKCAEPDVRTAP